MVVGLKTGSGIFNYLSTIEGATTLAITFVVLAAIIFISNIRGLKVVQIIAEGLVWTTRKIGRIINKKEYGYHRDVAIGKAHEKTRRVKIYRFLNELTIDLGLKESGTTPYTLLFMCLLMSLLLALAVCWVVLRSMALLIIMYPVCFSALVCVLYTKANIAHDARISAVIEAENMICSNIKRGVVVAVKECISMLPEQVRADFKDFIDNVEHKNYYIKTALQQLNLSLGTISDDFIKKCIGFELEEEHGIVGMFQDVVEVNNIVMEMRTEMKRKFEEVTNNFIIGATMIVVFLGGVMAVYPTVAQFYFTTSLGQIILAIDALIVVAEFVYITYLRAKEL